MPGGTGRYSRELAFALARTGPVDGVVAWHRDVTAAQIEGVRGPQRLPLGRRALTAAWERGLGPGVEGDVVLAPTPLAPPRRRAPLVVVVHDAVPYTHPRTLTPRGVAWHRRAIARAAAHADLVLVPTRAVADELSRHLALPRVEVVGEGVSGDLAPPPDAERRAAALSLPERFVLAVATLEPRKGLTELVAALPQATDLPLLVVGQQGWGELALAGAQVRLLGRVSDPDLATLLGRAEALVVPSRAEGFGLPLLEGMAAGLPVLTSDAAALVEVAGGAALAVPLAELVDGLRTVLEDGPLRARLRREGPVRAAGFTWPAAAARVRQLMGALSA